MLIEFSVENFRSFKDKVTFSMEKSKGDENSNNVFTLERYNLLKSAAIYGANASGKSNLIKALMVAISMVRKSNVMPIGGKWIDIVPFMFDEKKKEEPTSFEFVFIANGVKYKYFFNADKNKIYEEVLEAYYSQKPTLIFKREKGNKYTYKTDEKKLRAIEAKNTDNKLFLATATTWNYDKTKPAFLWFMNFINVYSDLKHISDTSLIDFNSEDDKLKKFTLKLLGMADMVIKDINVNYEENDMVLSLTSGLTNNIIREPMVKNVNIEFIHEIIDSKGLKSRYKLDFEDESTGTQILFAMAPFLMKAFENGMVIVVDELEKSLHPLLVKFIIGLFNNPNINKANSMLIFSTHMINLMDLELFRRDQIWVVDKNIDTGISDLYSLDSFSVRKNENIEKGYLNGRFDGIPFIKDDVSLWQD